MRCFAVFLLAAFLQAAFSLSYAQSAANSGTISGTVTDPTGAVVPNATVSINNPVSQYSRTATTDSAGHYRFPNLPFNPYHFTVNATGFASLVQDVDVASTVPVTVNPTLALGAASTTVTVEGGEDLVENDPTMHTDIDRNLFQKLPLESQSSSLSSLVTLASPGVAADSNGLFHGLGDHAQNSFSVDGQPITDQQSKVFSNQIPAESVQSLEVIYGAPPAEYGDKTSLVIKVTTRSGQGLTKPTGSISTSYGTFGSATAGFDLGYGGDNWGNFIDANGLNTGRFLDPPEFVVFHDKGNEQNIFDRVDYTFTQKDSMHLNLNYSRSWFQTPNAYDNLNVLSPAEGSNRLQQVGNTDQKSKIETFNIAPTYTRVIGTIRSSILALTPARMSTTTTRAAILSPTSGRRISEPDHQPVPHASERRRPLRLLLCEGHQQHQGRRSLRADLPARKRQPGRHRSHLQLALRRRGRQSPARVQRPFAVRCLRRYRRILTISPCLLPTT